MRIEALESAIIELKNNKNREIEQLTMFICEQESSQNNMEVSADEIEGFLAQISNGHISSVGEAMERLFSAIRFIKKLRKSLESQIRETNQEMTRRIYAEKMKVQASQSSIKY